MSRNDRIIASQPTHTKRHARTRGVVVSCVVCFLRACAPRPLCCSFFFFFNDTATTEIYTLSLHDALPISIPPGSHADIPRGRPRAHEERGRSEEHTSELQSRLHLVCRLLLEKKKHKH